MAGFINNSSWGKCCNEVFINHYKPRVGQPRWKPVLHSRLARSDFLSDPPAESLGSPSPSDTRLPSLFWSGSLCVESDHRACVGTC